MTVAYGLETNAQMRARDSGRGRNRDRYRTLRRWLGVPGQLLVGGLVLAAALGLAWLAARSIDGLTFRLAGVAVLGLVLPALLLEVAALTGTRRRR
ncbi:hypothetical protein [Natronosalvus rutilus]|uniref:Uncharacterized protein n=1 Tax=Natronosalvus rutilus TaxID=2953753 RepID=A0A9E7SW52_9EURY|nr:hypothetical protein [Natronosalvus rutilus]UTF53681.1 hypothetical protein NGM29_18245 [Natronosalvus rutilus]